MKHVKSSLEKKAELYNNLYSEGGTNIDNREFMVDFSRKRNSRDNNLQSSGASTTELVQITDEFGRCKMVEENSAEYRLFLATESRKLRMEEIQEAPGFGRGNGVNGQLGWNVDGVQKIPSAASVAVQRNYGCYSRNDDSIQIPYEHDSKRYDYRPMNHFEKDEVRNINGCLENQRTIKGGASIAVGGNGKTSRRDKREAPQRLICSCVAYATSKEYHSSAGDACTSQITATAWCQKSHVHKSELPRSNSIYARIRH